MSVLFTSIQVHRFVREKALHTNILGLEKPSCGSIYIFIISDRISVYKTDRTVKKVFYYNYTDNVVLDVWDTVHVVHQNLIVS